MDGDGRAGHGLLSHVVRNHAGWNQRAIERRRSTSALSHVAAGSETDYAGPDRSIRLQRLSMVFAASVQRQPPAPGVELHQQHGLGKELQLRRKSGGGVREGRSGSACCCLSRFGASQRTCDSCGPLKSRGGIECSLRFLRKTARLVQQEFLVRLFGAERSKRRGGQAFAVEQIALRAVGPAVTHAYGIRHVRDSRPQRFLRRSLR